MNASISEYELKLTHLLVLVAGPNAMSHEWEVNNKLKNNPS